MEIKSKGPLSDKSLEFSIRIVRLCQYLKKNKESVMSKQLIRCGTAVGALVREDQHAESKADFVHKLAIALKEANETEYWIILLYKTGYINLKMYASIQQDVHELISLLVAIIQKKQKRT